MEPLDDIGTRIDRLLALPPYSLPPEEHQAALLGLLKDELDYAGHRNPAVRNYLEHWPVSVHSADKIADLPYLPVGLLKAQPPLSLAEPHEIKRILASSSTTGQMPAGLLWTRRPRGA